MPQKHGEQNFICTIHIEVKGKNQLHEFGYDLHIHCGMHTVYVHTVTRNAPPHTHTYIILAPEDN